MTTLALCLDGPLAGRLIDLPSSGMVCAEWPMPVTLSMPARPEPALYRRVRWQMAGRVIECASCVPGGPADADVYEWLVSERAKQAVQQ